MKRAIRPQPLLIAALLLLLTLPAGQAKPPSGSRAVDRIQRAWKDLETFRCDFSLETTLAMIEETDVTHGSMVLAKGDRFRYQTPTQLLVSNGENLWRYSPVTQQVIIEALDKVTQEILPRVILFEYPKRFDIDGVREIRLPGGEPGYVIDFLPKDESLGVKDVTVWLHADDWITRRVSFLDQAGNITVYKLENIHIDEAVADSTFQFKVPANTKVYDLR